MSIKIIWFIFFVISFVSCKSNDELVFLNQEKLIFIDPGHGGKDHGCVFDNVYEDSINLKIASYLYEEIIIHHFMGYISRSDNYDLASLYAKNRKNEDLKKRAKFIEQSHCDVFISLHLNSYPNASIHGPMVYYKKENELSKKFASILQSNLNEFTKLDKIIHTSDFYLFRNTSKTGVLVECGFLSNHEERKKLMNEEYQKNIAHVIYQSIENYFLLEAI